MNKAKFFFSYLLLLILSFTSHFIFGKYVPGPSLYLAKNFPILEEEVAVARYIKLVAMGDVMLGSSYPSDYYLPGSFDSLLFAARTYFQEDDLVFANLEGVISDLDAPVKMGVDRANMYAFKQPSEVASVLRDHGFNMLSLANNHSNDFGLRGRESTVQHLHDAGIRSAGLLIKPWDTLTVQGKRVGLIAFSPNRGTLFMNDSATVAKHVQELKSFCDLVLVSFHGGGEGIASQRVTRGFEYYKNENRGNPYLFARIAIDNGADLVLGHGPHVPRALDIYKGKLIAYSLGNFCTYGQFSLGGAAGYAPLLDIYLDPDTGDFMQGAIHSFVQVGCGRLKYDSLSRAKEAIHHLSILDFPENDILFDGNAFHFGK